MYYMIIDLARAMFTDVVILTLLLLTVYTTDNATDTPAACNTNTYLYEKYRDSFGNSSEEIPNSSSKNDLPYRCLGMYDSNNEYNLVTGQFERSNKCSTKYAGRLILDFLDNLPDYVDELQDTCLSEETKDLRKFLNTYRISSVQKMLSLTCPIGLLYDKICIGCLKTDCLNGTSLKSCENNIPEIAFSRVCKDERDSILASCFSNVSIINELKEATEPLTNDTTKNTCDEINFIYQGLTSLEVIQENRISVQCYNSSSDNTSGEVVFHCYKEGVPLSRPKWNVQTKTEGYITDSALHLPISDLHNITCYDENDEKVAKLSVNTINSIIKEACTVGEEDEEIVEPSPYPTTTTSTSYSPSPPTPRDKFEDFYNDNDIWEPDNFSGMNAFDNLTRLIAAVGKLCVAVVSVMGRLTPVCGHKWGQKEADVFCRDAGKQVGKEWAASHFGVMESALNIKTGSDFYHHYLRNAQCSGTESRFIWCRHAGWFPHDCHHDAVVVCAPATPEPPPVEPLVLYYIFGCIAGLLIIAVAVFVVLDRRVVNKRYSEAIKSFFDRTTNNRRQSGQAQSELQQTERTSLSTQGTQPQSNFRDSMVNSNAEVNQLTFNDNCLGSISYTRETKTVNFQCNGEAIQRLNSVHNPDIVVLFEMLGEFGKQKVVCKSYDSKHSADNRLDYMVTEQYFLEQCDHPNIIKHLYQPTYIDISKIIDLRLPCMFFMEYLHHGCLYEYLIQPGNCGKCDGNCDCGKCNGHLLDVDAATSMINGGSSALHYVHNMGYVHGDISIDNFMVFINTKKLLDIKLGDFGSFYKVVDNGWKDGRRITARYTAPENMLGGTPDPLQARHPYKNDVWGWGLIMWEIASWVCCPSNVHDIRMDDKLLDCGSEDMEGHVETVTRDNVHVELRYKYGVQGFQNVKCDNPSFRHVALLQQLNAHNSCCNDEPDQDAMSEFYKTLYPNNISLPEMHAEINQIFKWQIKECIKGCLEVDPIERWSMQRIMSFIKPDLEAPESLQINLGQLSSDVSSSCLNHEATRTNRCSVM